ncbi:MAG: hypothetical protein Q9170_005892, partial [Blastenia crenularia]
EDEGSGGEDEDDTSNTGKEAQADAEGGVTITPYQLDIPASPSSEDDEEEMIELRKRVLASKPFCNPSTDLKTQPERISRPPVTSPTDEDSDAESDVSGIEDNSAFDNIIDATPVTDRSGIQAKQRLKEREPKKISASFSREDIGAPRRR